MRKSDKKMDNQLRLVLTDVCETALKKINGFQWLTHLVDYSRFPQSLNIVCVFDTNENLATFMSNGDENVLTTLIQRKLSDVGVSIKAMSAQITYDTEENCERQHQGKWADRLR